MTRKTQAAYEHALRYVHENVFSLQCGAMITDYECAMRQAIRKVVPNIKLLGCWFHYAQAIRRKVASISDLFDLIRTTEKARDIYYKIICLALLPHDRIERAFNEIALEALQLSKAFTPLIKYFQKQWLERVGPKNFSVFLEETRTTCSAEGYNGKLGKNFKTHPNFLEFIELLQWEELNKSNELEKHINGTLQIQPKKKYRERAAMIREESTKFTIPNKTNSHLFLNRMTNLRNNIFPSDLTKFENIVGFPDEAEERLEYMNHENDEKENIEKETNPKKTIPKKNKPKKSSPEKTTEIPPIKPSKNVQSKKVLSKNRSQDKEQTSEQKVGKKGTSEKVVIELQGPLTRSKKAQLAKEALGG